MPYCTLADMPSVVSVLKSATICADVDRSDGERENVLDDSGAAENVSQGKIDNVAPFRQKKRDETTMERRETDETDINEMRGKVKELIGSGVETLSGLAAKIGVNKGGLHRFLQGNSSPSEALQAALVAFLRGETTAAGRF